MDELNIRISMRIKELLKQRNWSIDYLAEKADLKYSTLQSWVKGKTTPKVELLAKLCNAFEISLSEFFMEKSIDIELTPEKERILNELTQLNSSEQQAILAILKTFDR